MRNIAILGDLHGHITLAIKLLKRWETETGNNLDIVFQVGDMGAYPDHAFLDDSTKRFAAKDPDELAYKDYIYGEGDATRFMSPDSDESIDTPIYFIAGNHEDFGYLESLETHGGGPVDYYYKLAYLPDGTIEQRGFKIATLGKVEYHEDPAARFKKKDADSIAATKGIDILLTHEPPYDGSRGSKRIRDIIKTAQPRYHFCGHWHEEGRQLEVPGKTRSYLLNEVNFRGQRLNKGSIGVLDLEKDEFEIIDEDWMKEYKKDNYKDI